MSIRGGNRRYYLPASRLCRAALRAGPLVRQRTTYGNGTLKFAIRTVEQLIASGEAVRIGNGVVLAEYVRKAEAAE